MTYILGSNCSDGVVLVGDRKVILGDGAIHEYEDKLFGNPLVPWLVVGSSGIAGLFEKFRDRLLAYLSTPAYDGNMLALTTQIEDITSELNETYSGRLGGQDFDVLLGIKSTTGAVLRYIYPQGFAEPVRNYRVIGHGAPYGSSFLKQWWHKNMTMLEVAELGFFIIRFIQTLELDNTVGIGDGYPQVWLIPHKLAPPKAKPEQLKLTMPQNPSSDDMAAMSDRVSKRLAKFKGISWANDIG